MFSTSNFDIAEMSDKDLPRIAEIYNSNPMFLSKHIGADQISAEWAADQHRAMREKGFTCCKIVNKNTGETVGFLEFKLSPEAYFSLLMVDARYKRAGTGAEVIRQFKKHAREQGCEAIRIDYLLGYDESIREYWQRFGFTAQGKTQLEWNGRELSAAKMIARL